MLKKTLQRILASIGILEHVRYLKDKQHQAVKDFDQVVSIQKRRTVETTERIIAVLPAAAPPGGLGDEALVKGLISYYEPLGYKVVPIAFSNNDHWDYLPKSLGVLPQNISEWENLSDLLTSVEWLYVIGADVMDGGYGIANTANRLKLVAATKALGIGATITGFSFNNRCPKILIDLFKKLPDDTAICLRDPESKKRFENLVKRQTTQVADLAFHMKPATEKIQASNTYKWLATRKHEQSRKLLGLNLCPHIADDNYSKQDPQSLANLVELYEQGAATFLASQSQYDILLIPHDYRGMLSDLNLSLILANRLQRQFGKDRVQVVDEWVNADEIKAFAAEMDIVFTGRMHLAIASISMGTPVACFTYQNKFEGLFKLVDLDMTLLASVRQTSPNDFHNMLLNLATNAKDLQQKILVSREKLENLSSQNFAHHIGEA
ncbi:polysaccharide pyruvyl transferase family protein [Gynuella sp.]|uniref:polysaccharide pyruvyl transferase family protein n=1 Tax=Gynuella sp. TaxID=2969146 RepID=UPI003D0CC18F